MNRAIRYHFLALCGWVAVLAFAGTARLTAQTFTLLHTFDGTNGSVPQTGLVLSGDTLYGTTVDGGPSGYGTVFSMAIDGSGFTVLHTFPNAPSIVPGDPAINIDGGWPRSTLLLTNNVIYGTTRTGGAHGLGTVFRMNTNGSNFTVLHDFTIHGVPRAGLVQVGDKLYGAEQGGAGNIFALGTNGTGYTSIYAFTGVDGTLPSGTLVASGDVLYGTAFGGGTSVNGTAFKINTDGSGFVKLRDFTGYDGKFPFAGLVLSGNTLYGTTEQGAASGFGNVFALDTAGQGLTTVHAFRQSDGATPKAGLILRDNTLFGTTSTGGSADNGVVFAVHVDGSGFTNLHQFSALSGGKNGDGATPYCDLLFSRNALYGTTEFGGVNGGGVIFKISLPVPALQVARADGNIVLTWPDAPGFALEQTTDFGAGANWQPVSLKAGFTNGQNTLIDSAPGTTRFYRLRQDL